MVVKLGVIGTSPGNGHPYSFSSIINGYNPEAFAKTEWGGILNYLNKRDPSEIGLAQAQVTHAWTQDSQETNQLCECAQIPHAVTEIKNFIGKVDGVLLARDDYENHYEMAKPLLDAGLFVFIDKPLSVRSHELDYFLPFLENKKLMSCSGMRFAHELNTYRSSGPTGKVKSVKAKVLNDLEKYGIHMIDALWGVLPQRAICVSHTNSGPDTYEVTLEDNIPFELQILGDVAKTFILEIEDEKQTHQWHLHDNFSMFKSCLKNFIAQIQNNEEMVPRKDVLAGMHLLMAAREAKETGRTVQLDQIRN